MLRWLTFQGAGNAQETSGATGVVARMLKTIPLSRRGPMLHADARTAWRTPRLNAATSKSIATGTRYAYPVSANARPTAVINRDVNQAFASSVIVGSPNDRFAPILLKKSKISPRQNSRKSELIAEFGWRCLLKHLRRPLVEFAPVEAVPHVPKRQAHQRFLENWSRHRIGLFQQNPPEAVIP
jgi:hypothetical protein